MPTRKQLKLKHFVLTRSAYSLTWPKDANERRLERLAETTIKSFKEQTNKDWMWIVLLNRQDPYLEDRKALYESVGVVARFILWDDAMTERPPKQPEIPVHEFWTSWVDTPSRRKAWDSVNQSRLMWRTAVSQYTPKGVGSILTTGIDDDDIIVPTFVARVKEAAEKEQGPDRVLWVFPRGFRYLDGKYSPYLHETNMMPSVQTWLPDVFSAYEATHNDLPKYCKHKFVDEQPAWMWVRHPDALSEPFSSRKPIDPKLMSLFPINWDYLRENK